MPRCVEMGKMNFGLGKEIMDKFNRSKYIGISLDIRHGDNTQRCSSD